MKLLTTCAAVAIAAAACSPASPAPDTSAAPTPAAIDVSPSAARKPQPGNPNNFTGPVQSQSLYEATSYSTMSGGQVTFQPGARTAWHTHPAGQTLIVTAGAGWVQRWDGPKQQLAVGDVARIPPNVKHWHGATGTSAMTHIAIAEAVSGGRVTWLEKVTDSQYLN